MITAALPTQEQVDRIAELSRMLSASGFKSAETGRMRHPSTFV